MTRRGFSIAHKKTRLSGFLKTIFDILSAAILANGRSSVILNASCASVDVSRLNTSVKRKQRTFPRAGVSH
jgi:hypothetical protein